MDDLARKYYRTIDEQDYDALASILSPDFVHDRPDRTIEGRDAFVRFMREERPETETSHSVDDIYRNEHGVAVRGRLQRADGSVWFAFVDVFAVENGVLASLETYTH